MGYPALTVDGETVTIVRKEVEEGGGADAERLYDEAGNSYRRANAGRIELVEIAGGLTPATETIEELTAAADAALKPTFTPLTELLTEEELVEALGAEGAAEAIEMYGPAREVSLDETPEAPLDELLNQAALAPVAEALEEAGYTEVEPVYVESGEDTYLGSQEEADEADNLIDEASDGEEAEEA